MKIDEYHDGYEGYTPKQLVKLSERRYKILFVRYEHVLELLQGKDSARIIGGLPEGVRVLTVDRSIARHGFEFLLHHESFDIVEDGDTVPRIEEALDRLI